MTTCWRRFAEWAAAGVFERLQELLLDELGQAGQLDCRGSAWTRSASALFGMSCPQILTALQCRSFLMMV